LESISSAVRFSTTPNNLFTRDLFDQSVNDGVARLPERTTSIAPSALLIKTLASVKIPNGGASIMNVVEHLPDIVDKTRVARPGKQFGNIIPSFSAGNK